MDPDIILYQQNFYKPLLDKANRLTEQYISDHKLVLTGGMAIDLALRARGASIYDDDALPDYDIISDKNVEHSNALARLLCKEGLPDINVINAVHVTTVRVRIKNIVLLDATYFPTSCFEKVPVLDLGALRVVHPHYQFINQRYSLAMLLANTGKSLNVFNRLKKDMVRNNLLRDTYPLEISKLNKPKMKQVSIPLELIKVDETQLIKIQADTFAYSGNTCVAGYVAYALMMGAAYSIKGNSLEIQIPENCHVRLLSCNIDVIKPSLKSAKTYRPILDLKPITLRKGDYEYVDTYGTRVSCNLFELAKDIKVCIVSVDYILMEMLRDRIYESAEPYTSCYARLVEHADAQREKDSDMIWWPSLNCYGTVDLPESKIFSIEKILNPDQSSILKPKTSYPNRPMCKTRGDDFDETQSHYFQVDGVEDSGITHTNLKHVLDEFMVYVDKKRKES